MGAAFQYTDPILYPILALRNNISMLSNAYVTILDQSCVLGKTLVRKESVRELGLFYY